MRAAKVSPAQVKQRVVRFTEVMPNWGAYPEAQLPAHQRALDRMVGNVASLDEKIPPGLKGIDLCMAIILAGPGRGAPPHDHEGEEVDREGVPAGRSGRRRSEGARVSRGLFAARTLRRPDPFAGPPGRGEPWHA